MKIAAIALGVLGGIAGVGLWLMNAMLICCALPPEYRKPIYPVDITPLLDGAAGNLIYFGTPLIGIAAVVALLMMLVPRFQGNRTSHFAIICGLLLAAGLSLNYIGKAKPSTADQFFPLLLWGVLPGLVVVVGGILSRRAFSPTTEP